MWKGPFKSVSELAMMGAQGLIAPQCVFSGEITTSKLGIPIGLVPVRSRIQAVVLSVESCGKDDTNPLSLAANVKINGTTCFSTRPKITYVSGESTVGQATTAVSGATGITDAVFATNIAADLGDMLSVDLILVRTASPTTEINNAAVMVQLLPY